MILSVLLVHHSKRCLDLGYYNRILEENRMRIPRGHHQESFKSEASFFAASCIKMANDIYMHHVQLRPGRGYLALGGGRAQVEEDEEGHV